MIFITSGIVAIESTVDINTYFDASIMSESYSVAIDTHSVAPGMANVIIMTCNIVLSVIIGESMKKNNTGIIIILRIEKIYIFMSFTTSFTGISASDTPITIIDRGTVIFPTCSQTSFNILGRVKPEKYSIVQITDVTIPGFNIFLRDIFSAFLCLLIKYVPTENINRVFAMLNTAA